MDENAATQPQAETGYSEEAAAQEILARMVRTPKKEQAEPSEEEQPDAVEADASDAEQPEEGNADAPEAEPEAEWEIEFAGQTHKLPAGVPEEVARKVQELGKNLHSDYTRKTQEIAETRKAIEQERATAQELLRLSHEHSDLVADWRVVQRQIDQLSGEDLMALSDTDPLAAQQKMARLMQLQNAQQRIGAQLQQAVATMQANHAASMKEALEKANAELSREISGWGQEKQTALRQYAASLGANDAELSQVTRTWIVKALHKARQYDELQSAKPAVTKRVAEAPKTIKSSSAVSAQANNKARVNDARERVRRTGKVDDAASAFLALMRK